MLAMTPIKKKATPKAVNAQARCAYCGDFQAAAYDIRWNVSTGISACKKHAEWAKWDCKIYMHKEGLVLLEDALLHPPIQGFIHALQGLSRGFSINGINGWRLGRAKRPVGPGFALVDALLFARGAGRSVSQEERGA